jgi:hypothetical protein
VKEGKKDYENNSKTKFLLKETEMVQCYISQERKCRSSELIWTIDCGLSAVDCELKIARKLGSAKVQKGCGLWTVDCRLKTEWKLASSEIRKSRYFNDPQI